ncbi:MAG: hypothetical protein ACK58T_32120 [Phycisphaerae bacterium]
MLCSLTSLGSLNRPRVSVVNRLIPVIACGLVTVFTGCGSGYSGPSEYEQYQKKRMGFVETIQSLGGKAEYGEKSMHGFRMSGWLIQLPGADVSDELISQIIEHTRDQAVFQLNFSGSKITDAQLVALDAGKVLQKTVELDLSNTAITDAGLDKLQRLYCLSELKLKGTSASKSAATRLGDRKIASPITPAPFKKQPNVDL